MFGHVVRAWVLYRALFDTRIQALVGDDTVRLLWIERWLLDPIREGGCLLLDLVACRLAVGRCRRGGDTQYPDCARVLPEVCSNKRRARHVAAFTRGLRAQSKCLERPASYTDLQYLAAERSVALEVAELPDWLDSLRKVEVTDRVRQDTRSRDDTLFGIEFAEAREVIGGGQADFDAPYGDLSPDDVALLYAYVNQKGHLEELVTAFGQLLAGSNPDNPIVVDIGCGPYTGGLALAATLGENPRFDYIGVDRADSMRRLGARLASSDLVPGSVTTHWAAKISSVDWRARPGWRDVIVIVSYLFASPTLDAEVMFDDLQDLLDGLGRGAVTLLYTNSAREEANRQYPGFSRRLQDADFRICAEDEGKIIVQRWDGPLERKLYYALFHRAPRRHLVLGD